MNWKHCEFTRRHQHEKPNQSAAFFRVWEGDKKERQNTKNTVVFFVLAMGNREDPRREERGEFGRVSRVWVGVEKN